MNREYPNGWNMEMARAYAAGRHDAEHGIVNQGLKYDFLGCYDQGFNEVLNEQCLKAVNS